MDVFQRDLLGSECTIRLSYHHPLEVTSYRGAGGGAFEFIFGIIKTRYYHKYGENQDKKRRRPGPPPGKVCEIFLSRSRESVTLNSKLRVAHVLTPDVGFAVKGVVILSTSQGQSRGEEAR
ncbi:hypothetical protein EVAR_55802_1 [Eumeta japonica]|uniref:Uncharacterized protein n=1 Tax=Eumeta variegata TaxID=151549 RepID=A0A4C1YP48_EUMVA|nr:hypothetical protein EVAR_55802_1 [Eumeta japonica]